MVLVVQLNGAQVVQVRLAVLVLLLGPLGIHTEPAQKTTVSTNMQLGETLGWFVGHLVSTLQPKVFQKREAVNAILNT